MRILSLDVTIYDLKYYHEQLYNSLNFLNTPDINIEDLYMTYSITDNGKEVDLIANGSEVPITADNKDAYLRDIAEYYAFQRCPNASFAFVSSFLTLIPHDY